GCSEWPRNPARRQISPTGTWYNRHATLTRHSDGGIARRQLIQKMGYMRSILSNEKAEGLRSTYRVTRGENG
ncbi:hypothetical protein, partial [Stutzerimonas stutzeri]|uniref:hypothetical protein n=1 Tax=Stutzerimonas stutzeri TaxID=316 RepID=UPI001E35F43C